MTRISRALARALVLVGAVGAEGQTTQESQPGMEAVVRWLAAETQDTVPKLIEALKHGKPSEQAAAARRLGEARADSPEAIAALTAALDDRREVRTAAAWALGRIGSRAKAAVPALAELLYEVDSSQEVVATALGDIGPAAKEAVPALEAAVSDGSIAAAKSLARIGPAGFEALLKALKSDDPEVRYAAAHGMEYLGPDAREAVAALAELAKVEQKGYTCHAALRALGAIGPDASPVVPAIVAVLRDGDTTLQAWALHALQQIGPGAKGAKAAIVKALDTDNTEMRAEAATALIAIGEPDAALAVVSKGLQGNRPWCWIRAIELLVTVDLKAAKSAALVLAEVMQNEKADTDLRIRCAKALTLIAPDDESGIAFLRQLVAKPDESYGLEAASTLIGLGKADEAVIRQMKKWLDAEDPRTVVLAAGELAQVQSERESAAAVLRRHVKFLDREVRIRAAFGLANAGIADPVAVKALAGELRKEGGSANDVDAIRAPGKIIHESAEARAVVEEALHAESEAVHRAARAAIQGTRE